MKMLYRTISLSAAVLLLTVMAQTNPLKAAETISVRVVKPEKKDLTRSTVLSGTVMANQEVDVFAKISGFLKTIHVDRGSGVEAGTLLAELEVPELAGEIAQAQAKRDLADADSECKRKIHERLSKIRGEDAAAVTLQDLELAEAQLKMAEAQVKASSAEVSRLEALDKYREIRAPFAGVIVERMADPGSLIRSAASNSAAQPLVKLQETRTVRVILDLPDSMSAQARKNAPATIKDVNSKRIWEAGVSRFAKSLDVKTRTLRLEIDVPNEDGALFPGMFVSVNLGLETRKDAITLPSSVIAVEGKNTFAWIIRDGTAARIRVVTGLDDGKRVEILEGLAGNETVIKDTSKLKEGEPVKIHSEFE